MNTKKRMRLDAGLALAAMLLWSNYCYAHGGLNALGDLYFYIIILSLTSLLLSIFLAWYLSKKYQKKWIYYLIPVFLVLIVVLIIVLLSLLPLLIDGILGLFR